MERNKIEKAIQVYDAICWHMDSEGRPPSVRELMAMVDVPGSATLQQHLVTLRGWGWISWEAKKIRTMRLTRPTEAVFIEPKEPKARKRRVA